MPTAPIAQKGGAMFAKKFLKARGIATVEMALVLPVLSILLFEMIDFGFAPYNQGTIATASREGARAGIILSSPRPTATDIQNVVQSIVSNGGIDPATVALTVNGVGGTFGDELTVAVTYNHSFFVLSTLLPGIPDSIPLTARTVMRLE